MLCCCVPCTLFVFDFASLNYYVGWLFSLWSSVVWHVSLVARWERFYSLNFFSSVSAWFFHISFENSHGRRMCLNLCCYSFTFLSFLMLLRQTSSMMNESIAQIARYGWKSHLSTSSRPQSTTVKIICDNPSFTFIVCTRIIALSHHHFQELPTRFSSELLRDKFAAIKLVAHHHIDSSITTCAIVCRLMKFWLYSSLSRLTLTLAQSTHRPSQSGDIMRWRIKMKKPVDSWLLFCVVLVSVLERRVERMEKKIKIKIMKF